MSTFSDFSNFSTYKVYRLYLNTMPDPNILFNLSPFRRTTTLIRRSFRPELTTSTIGLNPLVPMYCTSQLMAEGGMMLIIKICCFSIYPLLVYVIDRSSVSVIFRISIYGDLTPVIQHQVLPFFPVRIRINQLDPTMQEMPTGIKEFHVPTDSDIQIVDRMSLFHHPELSGRSPSGDSWLDRVLDREINRVEEELYDDDETVSVDEMDGDLVIVEGEMDDGIA